MEQLQTTQVNHNQAVVTTSAAAPPTRDTLAFYEKMNHLFARLKYFFTGKHDPMDLLNGVYEDNLPDHLTISTGMLKSDGLAYEAGDLVSKLYQSDYDNDYSFAKKLRNLPAQWGTLETLMYYDAMVNNGGHKQYFNNSDGAYLDLVENGLRFYKLEFYLRIFQRALFRFKPSQYSDYEHLDTPKPDDSNLVLSKYDDLDSLYFEGEPKMAEKIEDFIRRNLELYK